MPTRDAPLVKACHSGAPGRFALAGVLILAWATAVCAAGPAAKPTTGPGAPGEWKFVSIPDFVNVDLDYPQPKWDDALNYVLRAIKAERPDFVLVAGDLLMGRWWDGPEQIAKLAARYYPAWKHRFADHGLTVYAALGDHEIGDNPWPAAKARLVPHFEAAFVKYLNMPRNGPEHMKGLAWSLRHKNALVVALDVFETDPVKGVRPQVTGEQLAWLDKTLTAKPTPDHIIVMGHTPIVTPVRARASSRITLDGGRAAPVWQLMSRRGVDLYLCGEVHAITCTNADGVEQIAHGSLFGYVDTVNYLVGTVTAKGMHLELKRLPIVLAGGKLPQTTNNRPREIVRISEEAKKRGFASVAAMVIDKTDGKKVFRDRTGEFANPYRAPSRRSGGTRPPRGARVVPQTDEKQNAKKTEKQP